MIFNNKNYKTLVLRNGYKMLRQYFTITLSVVWKKDVVNLGVVVCRQTPTIQRQIILHSVELKRFNIKEKNHVISREPFPADLTPAHTCYIWVYSHGSPLIIFHTKINCLTLET